VSSGSTNELSVNCNRQFNRILRKELWATGLGKRQLERIGEDGAILFSALVLHRKIGTCRASCVEHRSREYFYFFSFFIDNFLIFYRYNFFLPV